jgi:hypothetical protein
MFAWTAVDAVAQNANNEITFYNFVGQALELKKHILTSKPGTNPPGPDEYIKLYDLLVKKGIIECKLSGTSVITWNQVCTINKINLKQNLSQITYPEEITKNLQVNKLELESFLENYKYNALDGIQLAKQSLPKQPIGHTKNQNMAQKNAKQSLQKQPVTGGKKKTRRKHRTRRNRYVRDTFFS